MPRPRRSARRFVAVAAVLSASAAILAAQSAPSTAAPAGAQRSAVVAGDARFEVLSPTLIRTEYAGDAHFVDAPTFNAIGRDGFAPASYTTSTDDGWLTIRTSALTLRYRLDSGAFTDKNLTVTLRDGRQLVSGAPWPAPPSCAIGVLCEAEDLPLQGPAFAADHSGYFTPGSPSLTNLTRITLGEFSEVTHG